MSQFMVNTNSGISNNGNNNNNGVWGQVIIGLSTIRTEVTSLRDGLVGLLRSQFAFNGGITTSLVSRFRYDFPSLQALPVGILIQDVVNNSTVTSEQIAFFNTVSLKVLVATGRRLRVISQDRSNSFYIRLMVDLDTTIGTVSSLRVVIDTDDPDVVISANSIIFLEFFNDLPLV